MGVHVNFTIEDFWLVTPGYPEHVWHQNRFMGVQVHFPVLKSKAHCWNRRSSFFDKSNASVRLPTHNRRWCDLQPTRNVVTKARPLRGRCDADSFALTIPIRFRLQLHQVHGIFEARIGSLDQHRLPPQRGNYKLLWVYTLGVRTYHGPNLKCIPINIRLGKQRIPNKIREYGQEFHVCICVNTHT